MLDGPKPNCRLIECLVDGWPYLLVITTRPVVAGGELLMTYGSYHDFWDEAAKATRMLHDIGCPRPCSFTAGPQPAPGARGEAPELPRSPSISQQLDRLSGRRGGVAAGGSGEGPGPGAGASAAAASHERAPAAAGDSDYDTDGAGPPAAFARLLRRDSPSPPRGSARPRAPAQKPAASTSTGPALKGIRRLQSSYGLNGRRARQRKARGRGDCGRKGAQDEHSVRLQPQRLP